MNFLRFILVCVSLYCAGVVSIGAAIGITPCAASNKACLKSSAQAAVPLLAAGIPTLGISTMDPMSIPRVSASQAGLDMDFTNTLVKGLRNCIVEKIRRSNNQIEFSLRCSVTLTGDYTLGGKLLILPVEGKGRYRIKIRDIVVDMKFVTEEYLRGGERYWSTTSFTHSSDVKTGAHYQFENLFNGNKQLSDTLHTFANGNWREIFREVAPPIVNAIVNIIYKEVQKLFDQVPVSQLSL